MYEGKNTTNANDYYYLGMQRLCAKFFVLLIVMSIAKHVNYVWFNRWTLLKPDLSVENVVVVVTAAAVVEDDDGGGGNRRSQRCRQQKMKIWNGRENNRTHGNTDLTALLLHIQCVWPAQPSWSGSVLGAIFVFWYTYIYMFFFLSFSLCSVAYPFFWSLRTVRAWSEKCW